MHEVLKPNLALVALNLQSNYIMNLFTFNMINNIDTYR